MFSCERKAEPPIDMQPDTDIPVMEELIMDEGVSTMLENFLGNERTEHEENPREAIVYDALEEGTQVELILKRSPRSGIEERIVYVDWNVKELNFFKCPIIAVEGLGQLRFLETIVFDKCAGLSDYSFLKDLPQLKKLFIVDSSERSTDWSFVEKLSNLEVLYHDGHHQSAISIDLKNNAKLEYLGFTYGYLQSFHSIYNVPNSLKYLNLQGNQIKTLPPNIDDFRHTTVFLGLNPIYKDETIPDNATFDFSPLEEKYRLPLNIPFISEAND